MTHPLVDRLTTEFGWPRFDDRASLDDWTRTDGVRAITASAPSGDATTASRPWRS